MVRQLKGYMVVGTTTATPTTAIEATGGTLADLDPDSFQAAIQRLFDASVILEDSAFHGFVGALYKLSLEMVSMQCGTDVGTVTGIVGEGTLDAEDDLIPSASTSATSFVTPCTELFSRRKVSGIHIPSVSPSTETGEHSTCCPCGVSSSTTTTRGGSAVRNASRGAGSARHPAVRASACSVPRTPPNRG